MVVVGGGGGVGGRDPAAPHMLDAGTSLPLCWLFTESRSTTPQSTTTAFLCTVSRDQLETAVNLFVITMCRLLFVIIIRKMHLLHIYIEPDRKYCFFRP